MSQRSPIEPFGVRIRLSGRVVAGRLLPPLVPLVAVAAVLEALVRLGAVKPFLVPAPTQVLMALVDSCGPLLVATGQTAAGALIGFALSVLVGTGTAVGLSWSPLAQRALYPYAVFFQTVPIIAIAPLLVIWFGNDLDAVIASACIVSVFPVIANTLTGLRSTEAALCDLFRLYGASRWTTLWKLRLPAALPNTLTGLRIGAGLSVIGAIVGEFITTGSGLGGLLTVARQQQRTDLVFAGLLLSAVLGIAMFVAINLVSARCLRHWHPSEQSIVKH